LPDDCLRCDWIKVYHDGSVTATFTDVLILPAQPFIFTFEFVQTWVPVEGLCNYQLKQENLTDYLCLPSRQPF
jgi:hypothetical protein